MPVATLERGGRATARAPSDAPEGSGGSALEEAPDVARLLKRFDEMYTSSGTTAEVEIVITTPKGSLKNNFPFVTTDRWSSSS